jgi:hypothetical protein
MDISIGQFRRLLPVTIPAGGYSYMRSPTAGAGQTKKMGPPKMTIQTHFDVSGQMQSDMQSQE